MSFKLYKVSDRNQTSTWYGVFSSKLVQSKNWSENSTLLLNPIVYYRVQKRPTSDATQRQPDLVQTGSLLPCSRMSHIGRYVEAI